MNKKLMFESALASHGIDKNLIEAIGQIHKTVYGSDYSSVNNNDNVQLFMEGAASLGLSKVQMESLGAILENCFNHSDAQYLYVKNDSPEVIYTYRGIETEYNHNSHLINRFTYWLNNEIRDGYIKRIATKEELKSFILSHLDTYYSSIMYDNDLNSIKSIDDFKVCLMHDGNGVDNKIQVISNKTKKELFDISLIAPKSTIRLSRNMSTVEAG